MLTQQEKSKRWYQRNRERTLIKCRAYHKKNKKRIAKRSKKYREANKEVLAEKGKEFLRNNKFRFTFTTAKRRAKRKNIAFDLAFSELVLPTHCPYLGIPLEYKGGNGLTDNSPSLDRIVPKLGYIKGNVIVCSHKANTIKSFGTAEEHRKIADKLDQLKENQNETK